MSEDKFEMCKGRRVKDLDLEIDPEMRKKLPDIDEVILDEGSFMFIKEEMEKAKIEGIKLKLAVSKGEGRSKTWELQRA